MRIPRRIDCSDITRMCLASPKTITTAKDATIQLTAGSITPLISSASVTAETAPSAAVPATAVARPRGRSRRKATARKLSATAAQMNHTPATDIRTEMVSRLSAIPHRSRRPSWTSSASSSS